MSARGAGGWDRLDVEFVVLFDELCEERAIERVEDVGRYGKNGFLWGFLGRKVVKNHLGL